MLRRNNGGDSMLVVTTPNLGEQKFQCLGIVSGSTVQSKNVVRDRMAGFKSKIGGELKGYTDMLDDARGQAEERMIEDAKQMGANAIIGVSFSSNSVDEGTTEILAYGTAVKFM